MRHCPRAVYRLREGCVLSLFYYANQTIHSVIQSNQTFTIRCWHKTIANISWILSQARLQQLGKKIRCGNPFTAYVPHEEAAVLWTLFRHFALIDHRGSPWEKKNCCLCFDFSDKVTPHPPRSSSAHANQSAAQRGPPRVTLSALRMLLLKVRW